MTARRKGKGGAVIVAQHRGTCGWCGAPIEPGQTVQSPRVTAGVIGPSEWSHEPCERARRNAYTRGPA